MLNCSPISEHLTKAGGDTESYRDDLTCQVNQLQSREQNQTALISYPEPLLLHRAPLETWLILYLKIRA